MGKVNVKSGREMGKEWNMPGKGRRWNEMGENKGWVGMISMVAAPLIS